MQEGGRNIHRKSEGGEHIAQARLSYQCLMLVQKPGRQARQATRTTRQGCEDQGDGLSRSDKEWSQHHRQYNGLSGRLFGSTCDHLVQHATRNQHCSGELLLVQVQLLHAKTDMTNICRIRHMVW